MNMLVGAAMRSRLQPPHTNVPESVTGADVDFGDAVAAAPGVVAPASDDDDNEPEGLKTPEEDVCRRPPIVNRPLRFRLCKLFRLNERLLSWKMYPDESLRFRLIDPSMVWEKKSEERKKERRKEGTKASKKERKQARSRLGMRACRVIRVLSACASSVLQV